jgi:hypothetical protein
VVDTLTITSAADLLLGALQAEFYRRVSRDTVPGQGIAVNRRRSAPPPRNHLPLGTPL